MGQKLPPPLTSYDNRSVATRAFVSALQFPSLRRRFEARQLIFPHPLSPPRLWEERGRLVHGFFCCKPPVFGLLYLPTLPPLSSFLLARGNCFLKISPSSSTTTESERGATEVRDLIHDTAAEKVSPTRSPLTVRETGLHPTDNIFPLPPYSP